MALSLDEAIALKVPKAKTSRDERTKANREVRHELLGECVSNAAVHLEGHGSRGNVLHRSQVRLWQLQSKRLAFVRNEGASHPIRRVYRPQSPKMLQV